MISQRPPQNFIRPDEFWRLLDVRAGQTIVHLGCGAGYYLIPAAKIVGQKGQVIGIDIRQDMLDEANSRAERENVKSTIRLLRLDLESDPLDTLPAQVADWVLVANILHQTEAAKIFERAIHAVKPAGKIVVAEWDTVATPLGPPTEKRRPKKDILALAARLKLKVAEEFKPSPYHYGLLLTRSV